MFYEVFWTLFDLYLYFQVLMEIGLNSYIFYNYFTKKINIVDFLKTYLPDML